MQGTAVDVDGSTRATRPTPTRQVQPFQRQRPTRIDIKVPPIPARLGRNRRQRGVPRKGHIVGQQDYRARHRAVVGAREGSFGLGGRRRTTPFHRQGAFETDEQHHNDEEEITYTAHGFFFFPEQAHTAIFVGTELGPRLVVRCSSISRKTCVQYNRGRHVQRPRGSLATIKSRASSKRRGARVSTDQSDTPRQRCLFLEFRLLHSCVLPFLAEWSWKTWA